MIFILGYIKKKYKWINVNEKPDYDAISQKNSVIIHQISYMIFSNTDVLILSFFCGLKIVSIYSMYNLIISYVNSLINQISGSFRFKLGQTYAVDKKEYEKLHNMYEIGNMILVFSCFTLVYVLILPFMKLYTMGVKDINYIDAKLPILFIMVQLLSNGRGASSGLIDFAGHFKKTQWRAVLESVINIVVSCVAVQFLGIYGVLMGTIAALLYRANDMILYTYKYILHKSPIITYRRWFLSFVSCFISIFVIQKMPIELDSYVKIFFYGSIYMIGILAIHILLQSLFERKVYSDYWNYIKKIIAQVIRTLKI
jgi:O-antigen/teichoic acid export membrane protein